MTVWLALALSAACTPSDDLTPTDVASSTITEANDSIDPAVALLAQRAYAKASNPDAFDSFGYSVALSADGSTLVVGAPTEASAATGLNGNQTDNSAPGAGAVYVFTRHGSKKWTQHSYLKASNTNTTGGDFFGYSVAVSADGSTLAVGAPYESSAAVGIDGNQADETAPYAGAVYVFSRHGLKWSQQAYVKASNTSAFDFFGYSVALSADGSTLAVGAYGEDSAAAGIGGSQADETASDAGAVYVFTRGDATWSQQAYVKPSNTDGGESFGYSVALSSDGSTLAVGAYGENSAATGINGSQADDSASYAGAVYVFARSDTAWCQEAYVKASNAGEYDGFGVSVSLSSDGSTLAVGAMWESSAATGIGGDQTDNTAPWSGAAYVFGRSGRTWNQEAYVKASNTDSYDSFGVGVALSGDGAALAVSAPWEASAATGIGGNQTDDSAGFAGATYVFGRNGVVWTPTAYIKASNAAAYDYFGNSLALSGDGSMLAVGAPYEDSAARGIDGDQADDAAESAGAVYLIDPRR
ncbi:MAG TPA: hypothetical protein VNO30_15965 [Kofleriaceae bacterium]|nr:hypothetical protein [Kofleriaceae bacterium]